MRRWTVFAGAILILFLGGGAPSWAQEGPYWGYELGYVAYREDLEGNELGFSLRGGYGSSRPVSVELRADYGRSRTYQLGAAVTYPFLQEKAFRPFVQAGWAWYAILVRSAFDDGTRFLGNGPDIGIGFDYFIRERTSLGLMISQRFITYHSDDDRIKGDINGDSTFLAFRLNQYF
jgi:hypothetical protein